MLRRESDSTFWSGDGIFIVPLILTLLVCATWVAIPTLLIIRSRSAEGQVRACARDFGASPSLIQQVRDDPSVGLSYNDQRGWHLAEAELENSQAVGDVWDWTELKAVDCEAPFD